MFGYGFPGVAVGGWAGLPGPGLLGTLPDDGVSICGAGTGMRIGAAGAGAGAAAVDGADAEGATDSEGAAVSALVVAGAAVAVAVALGAATVGAVTLGAATAGATCACGGLCGACVTIVVLAGCDGVAAGCDVLGCDAGFTTMVVEVMFVVLTGSTPPALSVVVPGAAVVAAVWSGTAMG